MSTDDDFCGDAADGAGEDAAPSEPLDPARVAVRLMLDRALAQASVTVEVAAADGTVTLVLLPDEGWDGPECLEWQDYGRPGDQDARRNRGWSSSRSRRYAGWAAYPTTEKHYGSRDKTANEEFAGDVHRGLHCCGFAADPNDLPIDLVAVADHRLVLLPLTATDASAIAAALCGSAPTLELNEDLAKLLTPRLLRLARRPGQSADAYVGKLLGLLDARVAVAPTAFRVESPRAALTLERLHGMKEAVSWEQALARDLAAFKAGAIAWADVDGGLLLSGPPGCGKTMFAQALAATCDVPFVSASHATWQGAGTGHLGDLLKSMAKTFRDAKDRAPCVLFIDEIDSFSDRATLTHDHADYEIKVVNGLLAEMDGVGGREGVVVVGACNSPDGLDPTLVRSGRLDRHIRVRLPDRKALAAILREHLGSDLSGCDLSEAALAASGSSGADCERLVRGARRRARADGGRPMAVSDLLSEVRGDGHASASDLAIAATHEAGHALAAQLLRPGSVTSASVLRSEGGGGSVKSQIITSPYPRAEDLRKQMIALLAGRAAEHEVLGEPSAGSGGSADSDLALATTWALRASAALGLDGGGLTWRGIPNPRSAPKLLADPVLAARVQAQVEAAYSGARELVRQHLPALRALASALVERGVLDGDEVSVIVARHAPGAVRPAPVARTLLVPPERVVGHRTPAP